MEANLAGCQLLAGRVAVVTGGAHGLGGAIAQMFAAAGARGAVLDRDSSFSTVPEGWIGIEVDVTDDRALSRAMATAAFELGPFAIVVANAGTVPPWTDPDRIDTAEWDSVFTLNVRAVMVTIREALPRFRAEGGSIVAMASLNGWKGDPHIPAYVASKHAVVGIVRSMALALGPRAIRVNALAPGPVPTTALLDRMNARAQTTGQSVAGALQAAAQGTALGRVVEAEEVACAALFLASDWASGITGHVLPVDSGVL